MRTPLRFVRPLFPSALEDPTHYVAMINPTLWYNDADKWLIGLNFRSSYLMMYHKISGGFNYGLSSRKVGYYLNYSTLVSNGRIQLAANTDNYAGMRNYGLEISSGKSMPLPLQVFSPGLPTYPQFRNTLFLRYSDKYDAKYFDPKWFSLGISTVAGIRGEYIQRGYQGLTRITYSFDDGWTSDGAILSFTRGFAGFSQDLRLIRTGELTSTISGSVGGLSGHAPKQDQLCIARGVPRSSVDPINKFIATDGGGVRGYQNEAVLGNRLWAVNLELSTERLDWSFPSITPVLFYDVGRIGSPMQSRLSNRVLSDAGIEFRIMKVMYLSLPLWLSDPDAGQNHFHLRANAGLYSIF